MFSVDNFYDVLNSHYGFDKTQVMLWKFTPDGSKDFMDLKAYYEFRPFMDRGCFWNVHGAMVLHDQEPFFPSLLDTYRHYPLRKKNHSMWLEISDSDLMLMPAYSCSWQIFCHSEANSEAIDFVKKTGLIDCHYFWHGLIARDWFRHWKHHADLRGSGSWDKRFLLYAREHTGTREYRLNLIKSLTPLKNNVEYNWDGKQCVDSTYSAKITVQDAKKAAIHIVAETVFDQNKVHLTEKSFKPVVMRQPFITFAGCGALQYLRSYGFRTFDSVWNESYDLEPDHDKRFAMLIQLINKLHQQSTDEFRATMQRCQEIVDYNHEHFFSERFENALLSEMHYNISNSIDIQRRRAIEDPGGSFFTLMNSLRNKQIEISSNLAEWQQNIILSLKNLQPERYAQVCKQYPWVPLML